MDCEGKFGSLGSVWAMKWSVCGQIHDFTIPSRGGFTFIENNIDLTGLLGSTIKTNSIS